MKKLIFQGLISLVLFFACWYLLSQVQWLKIFKVERLANKTEEKVGDMIWSAIKASDQVVYDKVVTGCVDSIFAHICQANNIDVDDIHIHVMMDEEVNAFALPDGHLIVNTGLIKASKDEAALAGVMAHELAHIQKGHVMKKLIKEMGLSTVLTMTSGGAGSEVLKEMLSHISSSAYDRTLEKEADIQTCNYLIKAQVDPNSFADFLYNLGSEDAAAAYLNWISTHPDSRERGEYILEYSKGKFKDSKKIVSKSAWENMFHNLGHEVTD